MFAHALSLSHPGIRCRCLAAYGDAVSAVKWYFDYFFSPSFHNHCFLIQISVFSHYTFSNRASRLGREHHDDLAQFMLGMGYATEALHLPGISKRYAVCIEIRACDFNLISL